MGTLGGRSILCFLVLVTALSGFLVEASPAGTVVKQLSSLLKWSRASIKPPHSDGNVLQFENGYLVETLVEGNKLGVEPYTIRVSPEGELFAVDSVNSNIVRITPPLSQYSRARLVAGSFQGYSGHVDGKPSDARFNHPKGVAMDEKGNVYVSDTSNRAIRKIGESGVTTIAGGKSNVAGYRDGPSEDAKFSNDFDVMYVGSICSLLVIDRGNAALRQIALQQEDCDYQYSSISVTDIIMVIGAMLIGYASCLLQHGFGSSLFTTKKVVTESQCQDLNSAKKPALHGEYPVDDPDAGWPSFGRLLPDLSKFGFEILGNVLFHLIPQNLLYWRTKKGLAPLKDHLVMPEDKAEPPVVQKQKNSPTLSQTFQSPSKSQKISKQPAVYKDHILPGKHRSFKRTDYAEFYGSEDPFSGGSKSQKERARHRTRDKNGDAAFVVSNTEPKPLAIKSISYGDPNFDHFNIRSKFTTDGMRF